MQLPVWIAAALALAACEDPPPSCFSVDTTCAPLYTTATFAPVYGMTISRSCGPTNGSCHSASGDSGLSFASEQAAYDNLLAHYVTPGDPSCSEFIVRTSSTGKDYTMPKGSSALVPAERCSLIQWVQGGAPR